MSEKNSEINEKGQINDQQEELDRLMAKILLIVEPDATEKTDSSTWHSRIDYVCDLKSQY